MYKYTVEIVDYKCHAEIQYCSFEDACAMYHEYVDGADSGHIMDNETGEILCYFRNTYRPDLGNHFERFYSTEYARLVG